MLLSAASLTMIGERCQYLAHFQQDMCCCESDFESKVESGDLESDEAQPGDTAGLFTIRLRK
jgi:hypothetical protein